MLEQLSRQESNLTRFPRLFSLLLLISASGALAVPACFEKSPALTAMGQGYFSETPPVPAELLKDWSALLEKITGNWLGDTVSLTCVGNPIHSQEHFAAGEVSADIDRDGDGRLIVRSIVDYAEKPDADIDFKSLAGSELATIKATTWGLTASEKYSQEQDDDAVLVENTYDVRVKDGGLTLIRTTYINGLLESAQIFGMTRPSD